MNRNYHPKLWQSLVALAFLAAGLSACSRSESPLPATTRTDLQNRVTNSFPRVVMFKSAASGADQPLPAQLAPILIQPLPESADPNAALAELTTALGMPAVSAHSNVTTLAGKSVPQFTYWWTYAQTTPDRSPGATHQGIRITLNSAGAPVIWEVLGDSSGADVIYVAQSVEILARAEFGLPQAERKFSVEQSLTAAPHTVVAHVIDDGPALMGPIVYLDAAARNVSAVICRCMPAQFQELSGQRDYLLQLKPTPTGGATNFPSTSLEKRLRLPKTF
jgi:hypothetical protein